MTMQAETVLDQFEAAVQRFGSRPAFSQQGVRLSYRQLDVLSRQFAAYLQQHTTLQPGDRIAVQIPNLLQYPVVVYGAWRAGLVVVNVNPLFTRREMQQQFIDSGCRALVVLSHFADAVASVLPDTDIQHVLVAEVGDVLPFYRRWVTSFVVRHVRHLVPDAEIPGAVPLRRALNSCAADQWQPVPRQPNDLALLQYTGGTTGQPRGAMLSFGNLATNVRQMLSVMKQLQPGAEVMISPLPLYHIFAFTVSMLGSVQLGALSVLVANPREQQALVADMNRQRFTMFVGLNTLFVALLNYAPFRRVDFSRLKLTVAGGMALMHQPAEEWAMLTGCPVCEGYGLTETAPVVCLNPPEAIQLGTVGLPVPDTVLQIVDDAGQPLGIEQPGELWVRGPQVMMGYWKDQPAEAPQPDADGWLHTGDIAVLQSDGYVRLVDRKHDLMVVSGFNVYPTEIEEVAAMHPSVLESAAVGVPDAKSGEGIHLFVVRRDPFLTEETLMEHLRANLTPYKVPRTLTFCPDLPKSNVGKILRRALREH